jgi:hypothetical protein
VWSNPCSGSPQETQFGAIAQPRETQATQTSNNPAQRCHIQLTPACLAVCYNIEHLTKVQGTKKTEVHMHVLQHRALDEGPRDQENRSAPERNTRSPPKAQQRHNTTADHNDTFIDHKTKYYGTRQNRLLRVLHVSCEVSARGAGSVSWPSQRSC